jgi:hypothetical protein
METNAALPATSETTLGHRASASNQERRFE